MMARRRLSERQIQRIRSIQERRRQRLDEQAHRVIEEGDESRTLEGRVVVRHGANLAVQDTAGQVHHCLARQNIGHPVCGDRVVWQSTGSECGVVTAILERRTLLSRPDYSGRKKPLAANLTQLVVIIAPRPDPSEYLIDQYLVAAESMGVGAIITCNKTDLLEETGRTAMQQRLANYGRIGYPLLWISLKEGGNLEELTQSLRGETSILVGQSGVGKSSLVKALLPDRDVQIGRLSQATGLGRHTTSAATCYELPCNGTLIDSPGVRSFRLGDIGLRQLERGFRELGPYLGHCRFSNCSHGQEPGCALTEALQKGSIHPERLANFRHLARRLRGSTRVRGGQPLD